MRDFPADVEGVELAARDYGGSGVPLLLLHGGGDTLATWDGFASLLTPRFRVVAYDSVCHGRSGTVPPGGDVIALMLASVDAVAQAAGLDAPVLVGHSMGGGTASARAAAGPGIRALVCVDGAIVALDEHYPDVPDLDAYAREYREQMVASGWSGLLDESELAQARAELEPVEIPTFDRAHVPRPDGRFERRPTLDELVVLNIAGLERRVTVERWNHVDCPTLLLNAERFQPPRGGTLEERKALLADVAGRKPNITVEWLDAGHALHWERPEEIADRIARFVADT